MKRNIGSLDRLIRMGFGVLFIVIGAYAYAHINGLLGVLAIAIGLFGIFEALVGWCGLYALLGKNTCPVK